MKFLKFLMILVVTYFPLRLCAQEEPVDLFKMLDEDNKKADENRTDYTIATFKTTRLVNGHTIETSGKKILDIKISHRFGTLNRGLYELFGLDNATMRMGADYGVTNRLTIGAGRSTFEKQYDGFAKYKLLRQSTGKRTIPVSATLLASVMLRTLKYADEATLKRYYSDRLSYAFQLMVARKFSESTSLQIMPTVIHYNIVPTANIPNDILALGFGGRQKISKRVSINAEYYYVLSEQKLPGTYNSFSLGVDIETGGHVFQLHFTNSTGMTEKSFITETTGTWGNGDIHFGFNISRVFVIGKKNKKGN